KAALSFTLSGLAVWALAMAVAAALGPVLPQGLAGLRADRALASFDDFQVFSHETPHALPRLWLPVAIR
ncbi:MAG: hypothetical protein QHH80_06420, partial [Anaerolineae bacterium]|nr:hypothetical protein [Anaerolineae bacterium]